MAPCSCLNHVGSVSWSEVAEVRAGTETSPLEQIPLVVEAVLSVARWTNLGRRLHASVSPGWLTVVTFALGTASLLRALGLQMSLLATAEASSPSSSRRLLIFVLGRKLVILQPSESLLPLPF